MISAQRLHRLDSLCHYAHGMLEHLSGTEYLTYGEACARVQTASTLHEVRGTLRLHFLATGMAVDFPFFSMPL